MPSAKREVEDKVLCSAFLTSVALLGAPDDAASAWQRQSWQDDGLQFRRTVDVPDSDPRPVIVVSEFFSHAAISGKDPRVAVYGRHAQVPSKLLQVGPGDFCRVAFQLDDRQQRQFQVYYGGQPASNDPPPPWREPGPGLLLETRRWQACDLNKLDSVRLAFQAAAPLGSDFVPGVFQRHNPTTAEPSPFLSRYSGELQVSTTGKYAFFTSSQDCSFLRVDGKPVVAAPGRHGPDPRARLSGNLELREGAHPFEYWHAAAGPETCMVAAWQPPGANRPAIIPSDAFGNDRIARLPARFLEHQTKRLQPDFAISTLGEAPINEETPWMVRVRLEDRTASTIAQNARFLWDFGDGQTSDQPNPVHVYLHPGAYTISLTVRHGSRQLQSKNVVHVWRPTAQTGQKQQVEEAADYLPVLESYDASRLDSAGLLQLVRVYVETDKASQAARTAKAAMRSEATSMDDETVWQIATMVGPLLRYQMGQPQEALHLWRTAGQLIGRRQWRALCALEAADICLNDLLLHADARSFLEFATRQLETENSDALRRLHCIWGDWHARNGDAQSARGAYEKAQQLGRTPQTVTVANAWRGAHSRSTESFLRQHELDRAGQALRQWEQEFPIDKYQGYQSLLRARYWVGKQRLPNAVATANDLLTVNPESPYADQLLMLVGDCQAQLGRADRARAAYQSLLDDYPGSPLVTEVKRKLEQP